MSIKPLLLGVVVSFCAVIHHAQAQFPELNAKTVESFKNAIEPTEDESAFLKIAWESQLGQAVTKAYRGEKPLLIYVMNGHPLGCT